MFERHTWRKGVTEGEEVTGDGGGRGKRERKEKRKRGKRWHGKKGAEREEKRKFNLYLNIQLPGHYF